MTESGPRPLLPQNPQGIPFTQARPERREQQRNYVFVDEKNRHRRLKVVRACEGCRKRKIKCDAANTNTWPCSACIRLKMNCVPPALSFDKDENSDEAEGLSSSFVSNQYYPSQQTQVDGKTDDLFPYGFSTATTGLSMSSQQLPDHQHHQQQPQQPQQQLHRHVQRPPPARSNSASSHDKSTVDGSLDFPHINQTALPLNRYHTPLQTPRSMDSDSNWGSDDGNILSALGDLQISPTSVAPYIVNQRKLAEVPAVQEFETPLPQASGPDPTVRIPPEMMPSDEKASQYFRYFFTNIHPYIPVVNSSYFYRQWRADRYSISPLILEAIFACSAQMMGHATEAAQWLALATKHEECFKDVPRLSTMQGSLLLLKAREAVPRRGYYYRSWMSVVNLIAMAKDLDLHEHLADHRFGNPCGSNEADCATKTRVWHVLLPLELYIGSSQGRTDYGVHLDSIDFDGVLPLPGLDEQELQISQQFTFVLRLASTMREALHIHFKLRKLKDDWAVDPDFVVFTQKLDNWYQQLPPHLQISYPPDGSAPWIPFHFVANMHIYYNLCIMMLRRPQLQVTSGTQDSRWKEQMLICYDSAKKLCKLQEAVIQTFGMEGLLVMLRGINFEIFAVLTCTMIELVAITYPDPNLSLEARDYFSRHMRILERCSKLWPEAAMQAQIDSLRQAFSSDMSKPFEMKQTFPLGSPALSDHSSPTPSDRGYIARDYLPSGEDNMTLGYNQIPMTPPRSADNMAGSLSDLSAADPSMNMIPTSQTSMQTMGATIQHTEPQAPWNPARIFDQWTQAFGTPSSDHTVSTSPQQMTAALPVYAPELPQDDLYAQYQSMPNQSYNTGITGGQQSTYMSTSQMQQAPTLQTKPQQQQVQPTSAFPTYVTPTMWREAVKSSFGSKRRWNEASMNMDNSTAKRMMR